MADATDDKLDRLFQKISETREDLLAVVSELRNEVAALIKDNDNHKEAFDRFELKINRNDEHISEIRDKVVRAQTIIWVVGGFVGITFPVILANLL